jgi:hypothetical protein
MTIPDASIVSRRHVVASAKESRDVWSGRLLAVADVPATTCPADNDISSPAGHAYVERATVTGPGGRSSSAPPGSM